MKKLLALMLALTMTFSLAGCFGKTDDTKKEDNEKENTATKEEKAEKASFDLLEVKRGNEYDSEWCDDGKLYEYRYDIILLGKADAEKYPKLSKAIDEMNKKNKQSYIKYTAEQIDAAYEEYNEYGYNFFPHYDKMTYRLVRADEAMFSMLETNEGYWGGVHPNSGVGGINFDTETGEELTLDDISTDREALEELIYDTLMEKYDNDIFFDLEEDLGNYINDDSLQWTMSYQGITFYFSPYELASYAEGTLTAEIMYSEHAELFNEKYIEAPESYAVPLEGRCVFDLDAADDKIDEISCYTYLDEYDMEYMKISINGREYEDTYMYSYYTTAYLAHFENDGESKNYIYIEYIQENDYTTIGIYEIDGDIIRNIDYMEGSGFNVDYDGNVAAETLVNDVHSIILDTRSNMLSTMTVYRDYEVDVQTGELVAKKDYYITEAYNTLTSLIDMEVEIIGKKDPETIEAGEEFEFLRTDNKTYVDMKLSDGRECRLWVDISSWPYTVNGMECDECFKGMMYAG